MGLINSKRRSNHLQLTLLSAVVAVFFSINSSSSKVFVSAQTASAQLEVIGYECNDNLKEIETKTREFGDSVRICFEMGERSKRAGNLELLRIDNWEFRHLDVKNYNQRVIEDGDPKTGDTTVNCFPGKTVCSLETELADRLFIADGYVRGLGQVALQYNTGSFAGMTYARVEFPVEGTQTIVSDQAEDGTDWFTDQDAVIQFLIIFGVAVLLLIAICVFGACCFWNKCCADKVIFGRKMPPANDLFYGYEEEDEERDERNVEGDSKDDESLNNAAVTGMIVGGPENGSETQYEYAEDEVDSTTENEFNYIKRYKNAQDQSTSGSDDGGDSTLHTRDQGSIFSHSDTEEADDTSHSPKSSERINRTINDIISRRANQSSSKKNLKSSKGTSKRNIDLEKTIEGIVEGRSMRGSSRTNATLDSSMPPEESLLGSGRSGRTSNTFDSNMPPGKVLLEP
jgi:hypothetical protein